MDITMNLEEALAILAIYPEVFGDEKRARVRDAATKVARHYAEEIFDRELERQRRYGQE